MSNDFEKMVKELSEKSNKFPCDVRKILAAQMGIDQKDIWKLDPSVRTSDGNGHFGQPG